MNNITKIKIYKHANDVFEAFVNPAKIKKFWFSSSSERWEQGKTITLRYDEYDAKVDIKIIEINANKKIAFRWGTNKEGHLVTITLKELDNAATIVEVTEEGFKESDDQFVS